jgi:RNA-directed DNA polymerase
LLLAQQGDKLRDLIQDGDDIDILIKLLCRDGRLTIGAPSSPAMSNAVMFNFDVHWATRCEQNGIIYTRYADDLYFSTVKPKVLPELFRELDAHLKSLNSPRLRLNEKKTVFTSKKHRRMVTGITLTSSGAVSLGRMRKRKIKSLVHRYTKSHLTAPEIAYLKGLIAFANDVEPSFIGTLRKKYGSEAIGLIFA